ncbi:unnamed protein product [Microthlaspi erraticum]|uniref:Uncharacterized protein n=1 Tax=Microthlaspi erraticum TaxID=1685480 RepID=A0A6D2IEF2_9BRAS|nr:unnamed protein product [Microthlaspi erraticum]
MDFIKTSSLRALIELTFQRNWNGFIWMSRKGVIAKRVKTAPDGHIENQRPNAHLGQSPNRSADHASRPGKLSPRSAKPQRHAHRARPAREPGSNASRPRNSLTYRPNAPSEPGTPASGRETIGQIHPSDQPADRIIRPRPFRLGQDPTVRPIVPTDRPNAAVDPKPFLKPNPHNSSPKPAPT